MAELLSESEIALCAREQAKLDRALLRRLKKVRCFQRLTANDIEWLHSNGLAEFGGPSEEFPYNHERLTLAGKAELRRLTGKG